MAITGTTNINTFEEVTNSIGTLINYWNSTLLTPATQYKGIIFAAPENMLDDYLYVHITEIHYMPATSYWNFLGTLYRNNTQSSTIKRSFFDKITDSTTTNTVYIDNSTADYYIHQDANIVNATIGGNISKITA